MVSGLFGDAGQDARGADGPYACVVPLLLLPSLRDIDVTRELQCADGLRVATCSHHTSSRRYKKRVNAAAMISHTTVLGRAGARGQ